MFSPKLAAFIAEKSPESPAITLEIVLAAAKRLGMKTVKEDYGYIDIKIESVNISINTSRQQMIRWQESVKATSVVLTPDIAWSSMSGSRRSAERAIAAILEATGIGQVVIDLPEPVVSLPVPKWVQAVDMDNQAWLESTMYFQSELGELVTGFRDQLNDLLADIAAG